MFRTKKDVDKHCQEIFRNIKTERERNLRCLSIAQQYYNVRDYDSAKRYVILYLSVKDDSSVGHKLLAQCYDSGQEKEKALSEYKHSLQLDPKQPELILRVCELLCESSIAVDKNQAKYWLEKAETHFPYHPSIFKLKQKLTALNDTMCADTIESIIMDELKARPNDPSAHSRLLSFLVENGRIQEAYSKAFSKIPNFVPTLQWYQSCLQICKAYKNRFPNAVNEDFYGNYLFVLERSLGISVQDVKIFRKSIPECITFLAKFDEALKTSVALTDKSDNFSLLINHMAGQLCYHKANILYRKVKWDENSVKDVDHFIAPLLLLSTAEQFIITNYKKLNTASTRVLDQCARCNTYRVSQAGLVLLSRSKDSQRKQFLENILHFCKSNWRERIMEKLYSTSDYKSLCKSSFFVNWGAFSNLPVDLPKSLMDNVEQFVSVTEATQPASLHHLVWLGVQYLINSERQTICDRLIPLKFRPTGFGSLQFAPSSNIASSYAETLSIIDVEAFLYACVYCSESMRHLQNENNKSTALQILPADVSKLLCSPEQELWWESAYQMANQTIPEDSFTRVRTVLQRGIEVVRLMNNNNLPLSLLVLLGRTFVNRAAIEPNENLASALETRALLYWKAAVPLLNKIIRDEAYSLSVKSMFDYFGQTITKSEAVKLLNESKRFNDMQLLKGNNYAEDFFCNESVSEFKLNTSSNQMCNGLQSENVVDEKLLCTMMEQNTKIMDRLETLFNKHELLATNQLQLYEMVSVLAKKIDMFVIDSLTQAVQPLSPQNPAAPVASSAAQSDVNPLNSLATSAHPGVNYPFPFAPSNIQTNFPMYQPSVPPSVGSYTTPSFFPTIPPPSFVPPPVQPSFRLFDNFGYPAIGTPKITAANSIASTFSLGLAVYSSPTETKVSLPSSLDSTPAPVTNQSPNHSYHIKVPELSSIIKSPSVQIPEETADSDDEKRVVEHDPLPDFKPIIPLPDEVTVTTGEENEEILFESRAKLFRWADKEWKERGIGMFKILKNRDTGRVRILMRREIVHKICANHFLSPDMTLAPMATSRGAWIYCAPDFSSEEMVIEKLCVKFKTPEIAADFKQTFDKYKVSEENNASPVKSKTTTPVVQTPMASPIVTNAKIISPAVQTPVASPVAQPSPANNSSKKIIVAPPSLTVDKVVKEETDLKPKFGGFAFGSPKLEEAQRVTETKPNVVGFSFTSSTQSGADTKPSIGGFTFTSSPIVTQPEKEKPKVEEKPKISPFSSFTFNSNGPFSGAVTSSSETPEQKQETDKSAPFSAVPDTIDFSSLSKNFGDANAFTKSKNFKGFAGAGSLVFGSSSPSNKTTAQSPAVSAILDNLDSKANDSQRSENAAEDEFVPDAEFAPVVPLPDLIEVKTGEEGLDLLYEEHCKLFRFVGNEWKERGVGRLKIFRDPSDGSVRMLMRRDQVHKVCCNQRISANLELMPMKTNNKAWTWSNQDFSEGELKNELFCVRFKTIEQAEAFRKKFEEGQKLLTNSPGKSSASASAPEKPSLPSLAEQFKRDPSTWECKECYVVNKKDADRCSACETPKEGAAVKTPATTSFFGTTSKPSVPKSEFKFGMPSATPSTTSQSEFKFGIPSAAPSTTAQSVFSFGTGVDSTKTTSTTASTVSFLPLTQPAVSSVTTAPSAEFTKFSFGSVPATTTASTEKVFSFGSLSKATGQSSLFGGPNPSEGVISSKPKENVSIFGGSPLKAGEPTSIFGGTPLKAGESTSLFGGTPLKAGEPISIFGGTPLKAGESTSIFGGTPLKAGEPISIFSGTPLKATEPTSIFSGTPLKASEPTSAFSSFSFKLDESQTPKATFSFGSRSSVDSDAKQHLSLHKEVPLLIRDENDKLLFETSAKLYRFESGEWVVHGFGRILVSRNAELDKCRLLMFREPFGVVACLNHYLREGVTFATYDQRSWIWSAADFAEGEIICEKFCLIFENDVDATAFRTTLENVIESNNFSDRSSSTDEVEFVSETQTSEEDKKLAESLKLPANYFTYKYSEKSCPGCRGCDSEDLKNDVEEESCKDSTEKVDSTTDSTDSKSAIKPSFVFGASADTSWCKTQFNFGNVFNTPSSKDTSVSNVSASENTTDNAGSGDEEVVTNDSDPYFEPIIALPDVVETKTGEEDEETLFQERAKIFRYDEDKKEWKERGIGVLKILHDSRQGTYRLLLRREQVHKVVLNQRLTSSFSLQPLSNSKNSLCWFGMNFSEESGSSVLEKLAARFKTEEIVSRFEEVISSCVSKLTNTQANSIVSENQLNKSDSAEGEILEEEHAVENQYYYSHDGTNVEDYYNEQQDYVDEQGIVDAMRNVVNYSENDYDALFEDAATLQVVEDDVSIDYAGVVRIIVGFIAGCDEPAAFVEFSTVEVPSLYTAAITKEAAVFHEGDSVTFPVANDPDHDSKTIIRFGNEVSAEQFLDTFEKMRSCDAATFSDQSTLE